jgi:hypothetical protein
MSMFSFWVSLVPLHFDTVFPFRYSLLRFPKHTLRFLQRSLCFQRILSKFHCIVISYVVCALLLA